MFIPKPFLQEDDTRTRSLMDQHAFGLLVTTDDIGVPVASHIPFLAGDDGRGGLKLEGHLARPNEQSAHVREGRPALAVFQGPHAYISPTWYENPGVPTWNYAAVHACGRLQEVTGDGARSIIERLARKFEGDGPDAWVPEYPDNMLGGIVCFAMTGVAIQSKAKMSQNRPQADRLGVMRALAAFDDPDSQGVYRAMRDNEENAC